MAMISLKHYNTSFTVIVVLRFEASLDPVIVKLRSPKSLPHKSLAAIFRIPL